MSDPHYRSEQEAQYTVVLTYIDGFKKEVDYLNSHKVRGGKEDAHGGRPVRVDIYGEVPSPEFIYKTCNQLMHPIDNEGVHIHVQY